MRSRNGSCVPIAVVLASTVLHAFAQDRPMTRSERERARDEQVARDALSIPVLMDSEAAFKLAAGKEAEGNVGDAIRIYRFAARNRSGKAALRLGEIYEQGLPGVPRNYAESVRWYVVARDLGEIIPARDRREDKGRP